MDVDDSSKISKLLDIYFDLTFQPAASGFSEDISFNKADLFRPLCPTCSGLALLCWIAAWYHKSVYVSSPDDAVTLNITDEDNTTKQNMSQWISKPVGRESAGRLLIIEEFKNWWSKVVNNYTIPEYVSDGIDNFLDYGQYGNYVYKSKIHQDGKKEGKDIILFDNALHSADFFKDLKVGKAIDVSTKHTIIGNLQKYWDCFIKKALNA